MFENHLPGPDHVTRVKRVVHGFAGMIALQQCIQDFGEQSMVAKPGTAGIEGDQEKALAAQLIQQPLAGWIAGYGSA